MAECQLPKLNTGVRFPSPAPHGKLAKALIFNTFAIFYSSFPCCNPISEHHSTFFWWGNRYGKSLQLPSLLLSRRFEGGHTHGGQFLPGGVGSGPGDGHAASPSFPIIPLLLSYNYHHRSAAF